MIFHIVDWIALAIFVTCWFGFTWLIDHSPWRHLTLTAGINNHRRRWMRVMMQRDLRMIDTSIIAGLQNGTAFFASTSLFAIGGAFALLNATETVLTVYADLPFAEVTSRAAWETKVLGLMLIYAYAFFKFGWAYRLINYTSILIGSAPLADRSSPEEAGRAADIAAEMNILASRHFNRGLRAFFFSIGFLGWFANGWFFAIATLFVTAVLYRRQFHSRSRLAIHSAV
jgi:uncharacterized membrane protein